MKVNVGFDLNEHVRRSIRARDERGGKATRKEAKAFIEVVVRTAIELLPQPKVRKPKAAVVERKTFGPIDCACTDEALCTAHRERRERIRGQYRIAGHEMTDEARTAAVVRKLKFGDSL